MSEDRTSRSNPIAIVGMSGRFPGAQNINEFWANLRGGVESISFFSKNDLSAAGIDPKALNQPNFVNAGGVLADAEMFDAAFFGFTPREAESIDPQQRVFLECAWQALEDAGYVPGACEHRVGVFAGCGLSSYMFQLYRNVEFVALVGYFQILLGNDKDYLATHVSYKLNLKGPSLTVQTACSTSLVAVCQAAQSLLNGQCDIALAGGVNIRLPQEAGYVYQPEGIYSPDGHCRAFDASACGTVFGNGVGAVVLRRLNDALEAGDNIRAVIKGFAINNDGSLKVGYTAPGLEGQAEVISAALAMAGINPDTIGYVETHGTGTALGDPIEIEALTQAFKNGPIKKRVCALGSVKTNIGHLDPAAGVASLIKAVLALQNREIPPSLHFTKPNPHINFDGGPFFVNAVLSPWKKRKTPRRAGVSSFGIGGTNAHVVLEEAPARPKPAKDATTEQLLVLSTRTAPALLAATKSLARHLQTHPEIELANVAFTLQLGRKAFTERCAFVCGKIADAVAGLTAGRLITATAPEKPPPVFFLFPGQGTQYPGMAAQLYCSQQVFRKNFDRCSDLFESLLRINLRRVLFSRKTAARRLKETALAQPALFSIEYSLARLLVEWGVQPQAMIGHSVGEYVTACLAGVLSLEDAIILVAARSRLMQSLPRGKMLAVGLPDTPLAALLDADLTIAAINTPDLCVVSGAPTAVTRLQQQLEAKRVMCRELETMHAFHSPMVEPILDAFTDVVTKVRLRPPEIPYISNVTGQWATADLVTDPAYWSRHLRGTVRFSEGIDCLLRDQNAVFLETGPGRTLSTFARRHSRWSKQCLAVATLPQGDETRTDMYILLSAAARLWVNGVPLDWTKFHHGKARRRVSLPSYPFERQRYSAGMLPAAKSETEPRYQRALLDDWFYVPAWKRTPAPEADAGPIRDWLIFADPVGLGAVLTGLLRSRGHRVVTVTQGVRFARIDEQSYSLNPPAANQYFRLFEALEKTNKMPAQIVHLWSVTNNGAAMSAESFAETQETGFLSLVRIAKALIARNVTWPLHIDVVSNQVQTVDGNEGLAPAKATLLGPCKCIPQEYPNLRCRSIDVAFSRAEMDSLAEQISRDLLSDANDLVIVWRGHNRWVQEFENRSLPVRPAALREGGVYLLTGGLGNIGLAVAEYLAQTSSAKLSLVSRSPFPARADWQNWIADKGEYDSISRKIRKLERIQRHGGDVLLCAADVADEEQMRCAVRQTCEYFGTLNGVIHGAGTIAAADFRGITESDREFCERHFRPKACGLLVLERIIRRKRLDFCVLMSSLSSVLGGLGFTAYAAANLFLDAFARARNRAGGTRWLTINWDSWHFPHDENESTLPVQAMLPREGIAAFSRILADPSLNEVVVSVSDLDARLGQWIRFDHDRARPRETVAFHARPELAQSYVAPRDEMERVIAQIWQEVLGLERVGVHDNFFTDLSGHSLLATELVSRLRNLFQIEVPLASLFEGPTIAQLAVTVAALRQSHRHLREKPLAPTRRQERRATISAEGKLEMPDELRAELSKAAS